VYSEIVSIKQMNKWYEMGSVHAAVNSFRCPVPSVDTLQMVFIALHAESSTL
jgi:hypothetical protein